MELIFLFFLFASCPGWGGGVKIESDLRSVGLRWSKFGFLPFVQGGKNSI